MIGSMLSLYNLFIEPDFSFTLIYTVPVFGTTTNNNYRRLTFNTLPIFQWKRRNWITNIVLVQWSVRAPLKIDAGVLLSCFCLQSYTCWCTMSFSSCLCGRTGKPSSPSPWTPWRRWVCPTVTQRACRSVKGSCSLALPRVIECCI